MVRITKELLKKRAEHNEGILSSLEEITLHQYDIEKIELLNSLCRHLKILYLQNNQIEKIENLNRLKELQYLNLALNNISKIENLSSCESLNKLDLTLNFVDIDEFESSMHSLKTNEFLADLHLTGNPCTDYDRYRLFVIHSLPQLKRLDATEIKKSERILARQQYSSMLAEIRQKAATMKQSKNTGNTETGDVTAESVEYEHSVRGRKAAFQRDKDRERKDEEEKLRQKEENPFKAPQDVLKETRKAMCVVEKEGKDGQLPKQRNIGRYEFKMDGMDDIYEPKIRVIVEAPKYLDTSEMFVDIHPLWFQVIIKNRSLLLHLPTEVKVSESSVRRVMCNGWLELIMPKVEYKERPKRRRAETKMESAVGEKMAAIDMDDVKVLDSDLDFDEDDVPPLE